MPCKAFFKPHVARHQVQGEDLLLQIFTTSILQRAAGEEAPFLEFIQRVCSEKKDVCGKAKAIKAGCGSSADSGESEDEMVGKAVHSHII